MSDEYVFKVVILGDPYVGKTTLRRKFVGKHLSNNYLPTLGADFSFTTRHYYGFNVRFSIWDISGAMLYTELKRQYYTGAFGAVVVYDASDPSTKANLQKWVDSVVENSLNLKSLMVIANKSDLIENKNELDNELEMVTEALQLGDIHHSFNYTSALNGENVEEVFSQIGEILLGISLLDDLEAPNYLLGISVDRYDRGNKRLFHAARNVSLDAPQFKPTNSQSGSIDLQRKNGEQGIHLTYTIQVRGTSTFTTVSFLVDDKVFDLLDHSRIENVLQSIGLELWREQSGSGVYKVLKNFSYDFAKGGEGAV